MIWLAPYCPNLNLKEREWRTLKRDVRGHLARSLRAFADEILTSLARLGGDRCAIVDEVPQWFLDGHRRPPTAPPPANGTAARQRHRRPPTAPSPADGPPTRPPQGRQGLL